MAVRLSLPGTHQLSEVHLGAESLVVRGERRDHVARAILFDQLQRCAPTVDWQRSAEERVEALGGVDREAQVTELLKLGELNSEPSARGQSVLSLPAFDSLCTDIDKPGHPLPRQIQISP